MDCLTGLTEERMSETSSHTEFKIVFWVTQAVGIIASVLLAVWVFWFRGGLAGSSQPMQQFNWHVLCLPIATVYLCGNEIVTFRALRYGQKKLLKLIHAGQAVVITVLMVVGYWAIAEPRYRLGSSHWYSLHSWLGILSTILFISQALIGTRTFLWPGAAESIRRRYKPFHVFIGMTTLVVGTAANLMGMYIVFNQINGYRDFSGEGIMMNLCGMSFTVFTILVCFILTNPNYQRQPPEEVTYLSPATSTIGLQNVMDIRTLASKES